MKHGFVAQMEEILDKDTKVTHEELAHNVCVNPSFVLTCCLIHFIFSNFSNTDGRNYLRSDQD